MATVRAISGASEFSLSKGFKDFMCCYRSSQANTSKTDSTPATESLGNDLKSKEATENMTKSDGFDTVDLNDDNGSSKQCNKGSTMDTLSVHSVSSRHSDKSTRSRRSEVSKVSRVSDVPPVNVREVNTKRSLESLSDAMRVEAGLSSVHADEFADSALDSSFQSQINNFKGNMYEADVGSDFDERNVHDGRIQNPANASNNNSTQHGEIQQQSRGLPNEIPAPEMQDLALDVVGGDLHEDTKVISRSGTLRVTFLYNMNRQRLSVTFHEATNVPSENRVGAAHTQVRILLLPARKVRHKTKVAKAGDVGTTFNESFELKVFTDQLETMALRMRLYGCERLKRERLIGESIITFSALNLTTCNPTTLMVTLEPRSNLSHGESDGDLSELTRSDSCQDIQHGGTPEVMLALTYNGTTGRLAVEVVKGSNLKNMASTKPPDTFIKLALISPNGREITSSKTTVRRGQPNPLYKETFMFQVPLFQLPDVSLMVSVFTLRSMKRKEMIGWFSMGHTNSSEEELEHWTAMQESKGEQISRWHVLLEP